MKTTVLKGILIDAKNEEVREVEVSGVNGRLIDSIKKHLECNYFDIVRDAFYEFPEKCDDDLFIDDEGLLNLSEDSKFFMLPGLKPIAGNGLILGHDGNGETIGHSMTKMNFELLKQGTTFIRQEEIVAFMMRYDALKEVGNS